MISMRNLIRFDLENTSYLWIDVVLIKETRKAILIIFDGRKAWIPKAWLRRIKRNKGRCVIASPPKVGEAISIKISNYHWAEKFI